MPFIGERLVNGLDGAVKIALFDADDDVDLVAALGDHADAHARLAQLAEQVPPGYRRARAGCGQPSQ